MALIHLTNEAFDKATASGLAMVDFWATLIFLKDGKEIDRKVGVMPEASYTAVLDANL